jgi:hypothetical protein
VSADVTSVSEMIERPLSSVALFSRASYAAARPASAASRPARLPASFGAALF